MTSKFKRLNTLLMRFTLAQHEQRNYSKYIEARKRLELLNPQELNCQYIHLSAAYEQQKNVFMLFLATMMLPSVTGSWGLFYTLYKRFIQAGLAVSGLTLSEIRPIACWIIGMPIIMILCIILFSFRGFIVRLHQMHWRLLLMESVQASGSK